MSCTWMYWDNEIDNTTLTASTETANYEADNVKTYQLSTTWRTTGITSENVVIDAGVGNTISVPSLMIAGHNLTSSAIVTLQGNASDSWGAPSFSAVISASWEYGDIIFSEDTTASVAYRYWRIVIADTTNTEMYLEIGRIFLGAGYTVERAVSDSFSEKIIDTTDTQFSIGRQAYSDIGTKYRVYDLFFPYLLESTRSDLKTIFDTIGKHKPIFFIIDNENRDKLDILYCLVVSDQNYTYLNGYKWSSSLTFVEVK